MYTASIYIFSVITVKYFKCLLVRFFVFKGSGRHIQHNEDSGITVKLRDILVFITGADCLPPMGFDNDSEIRFVGDSYSHVMRLPYASTCGPTLYLPLVLSDPDVFDEKMDMAIVGAQCFGIP